MSSPAVCHHYSTTTPVRYNNITVFIFCDIYGITIKHVAGVVVLNGEYGLSGVIVS
jgi:hypothetical protein